MDHCASVLLAFPPEAAGSPDNETYDKAVRAHLSNITKLFKEQEAVIAAHAVQLLDCMNPSVNSISYLSVLDTLLVHIHAQGAAATQDGLLDRILVFLLTFDPIQIRYVGGSLTSLLMHVGSGQMFPPSIAVGILANAILRVDPSGSMLTSAHVVLTKLAYSADCAEPAYQVLDRPIVYYPGMANTPEPVYLCDAALTPPSYISKDTGLTGPLKTTQVLEYDLLAGMLYCARRRWAAAHAAFERVLAFPARDAGCSRIMVDAHNKWVLVSVLLTGRSPTVPSHTPGGAAKVYQTLGKPYLSLAAHFDSLDAAALKAEAEASPQLWAEDGNTGLVRAALAAHQKWQVAALRDVYAKISVAEVRAKTRSAETGQPLASDADAEALVRDVIASGMIRGRIETASPSPPGGGAAPYLAFGPAAEELTEAAFAAEIRASAQRLRALGPIFRATSERLGTSRDHARWLAKEQRREKEAAGRNGAGGGAGMGMGPGGTGADSSMLGAFDVSVEDEDLMTGVVAGH